MRSGVRERFTITLDPSVSRELTRAQKGPPRRNRSALVEEAVRVWLRHRSLRALERETEDYYRSLSESEREEDRQWDGRAALSAARTWKRG